VCALSLRSWVPHISLATAAAATAPTAATAILLLLVSSAAARDTGYVLELSSCPSV
jgi:hypothetical protein